MASGDTKWNKINTIHSNNNSKISSDSTGKYCCLSIDAIIYYSGDYGNNWNEAYTSSENVSDMSISLNNETINIIRGVKTSGSGIRRIYKTISDADWNNTVVVSSIAYNNFVSKGSWVYATQADGQKLISRSNNYGINGWSTLGSGGTAQSWDTYYKIDASSNAKYVIILSANDGIKQISWNSQNVDTNSIWYHNIGGFSGNDIRDISYGGEYILVAIYSGTLNAGIYTIKVNNPEGTPTFTRSNSIFTFEPQIRCLISKDDAYYLAYSDNNTYIRLWRQNETTTFESNIGVNNYIDFTGSNDLTYIQTITNNELFITDNGGGFSCFIEGCNVLVFEDNILKEKKVEDLKIDDILLTHTTEYKKIYFIGYNFIYEKDYDCIKVIRKNKINENKPNNDLFLLGGHSILFNELKDEYKNEHYNKDIYNEDEKIDNLIKIIPNHCTLFENINENDINNLTKNKKIKYFHFCLENENKNNQYGIYSNNILSETMSIEYIDKSNLYTK